MITSAPVIEAPPLPPLPPMPLPSVTNEAIELVPLYVGDLHPDANEIDLVGAFRAVVPVASVRLCRDRTRFPYKSLCYAYVNFFSHSDASKALASLNHTYLKGKPMRIMWCKKDPEARKTGIGNLFVKNLDLSITSARLEKLFSEYGTIESCKVAEKNGISKGFGFVQFTTEDSAMTALVSLHNTMLEGKSLYVSKFLKKSERSGTSGDETFTNLYVKNLDDSLTDNLLKEKFQEHGKVESAVIMKDHEGKSKGFGFVNFATHEGAKKAIEALNDAKIGSKTLCVVRAQKKDERVEILRREHFHLPTFDKVNEGLDLFVKNLDESIDDTQLKLIFNCYGQVTSAKVITDNKGVSKRFGFVSFMYADDGRRALASLNGSTIRGMSLYVAVAQNRDKIHLQYPNPNPAASFYNTSNCNFLPYLPYLSSSQPFVYPSLGGHGHGHGHVSAFHQVRGTNQYAPVLQQQHKTQNGRYKKVNGKWQVKMNSSSSSHGKGGDEGNKKNVEIIRPLVENNNQHEAAANKIRGMLLEMSKSNAQKLLNSPNSLSLQVEKAINHHLFPPKPAAEQQRAWYI